MIPNPYKLLADDLERINTTVAELRKSTKDALVSFSATADPHERGISKDEKARRGKERGAYMDAIAESARKLDIIRRCVSANIKELTGG
jgi:hypothetical protein